jgi:UDP-glucuronate decarboxylase
LAGSPITIYGTGQQTRSFCFVDDLVKGLVSLMNSSDEITGPINLGNPEEFTISELAERVLARTKSKSTLNYMPLPEDDPRQRKPDITMANELLGWNPEISLEDGLPKTIDYFQNLSPAS